jgi:glycerophosphoryl diester phosphodiesterase
MNPAPPSVLAIAHRAGNSLTALHQAVTLGADVIELDVHSYRGRLEVRHLKTMGPLPLLWDRWQLRSGRAPRLVLEEVLAAAARGTLFMLDLKGRDSATGEAVARHLHEFAPDNPVLVCSRYWPALTPFERLPWVRTIRSARTRAELALLLEQMQRPESRRAYGFSVHRSLLNSVTVPALHRHHQAVMTWPINDPVALASVLPFRASGTIGVISDELAILRQLLADRAGFDEPSDPSGQFGSARKQP